MKKGSPIMLRLLTSPHEGRAKDGCISAAGRLAAMGGVVGRRIAWAQSLAAVVDSPGDGVCARASDRHDVAAGRRRPPRLRRLLLLPATAGTQVQCTGPAAVPVALGEIGNRLATAVGRGRF